MDYKEEGLRILKEQLEKQGVSKHDIAVALAFNETAVDNLNTFISQLDNPVTATHSLRILSKLMTITAISMNLFDNEGGTNK
jgi:hypothetical protein